MINVLLDMETGDIDDAFTLFWLCDDPRVNLVGVTVTPGTNSQLDFIQTALNYFEKDIKIGTYQSNPKELKLPGSWSAIFPKKDRGFFTPSLIKTLADKYPDLVIIGGAPMKNLGKAAMTENFSIDLLVQQGGFVGSPIVPEDKQLLKFKGMTHCPTFNLGGSHREAEFILANNTTVRNKIFVGKNVCHACMATPEIIQAAKNSPRKSLRLIGEHVREGKALHDLLAATTAVDRSCVTLQAVNLHRIQSGHWGAVLENPNCLAAVDWNPEVFAKNLFYVG